MKKKKEPVKIDQDFQTKKQAVLDRKLKLSIKQKRSYNRPKEIDGTPKKIFDPSW